MTVSPRIADADFRYTDGKGNLIRSRTELSVARMLAFLNKEYEYNHTIPGDPPVSVNFKTEDGYIQILQSDEDIARYRALRERLPDGRIIAMGHPRLASRIKELDEIILYDDAPETGSIFLEDPSFAFDYAHILPLVEKCSILHGHTSSVMVELVGKTKDNLLVDFSEAKRIVRDVVGAFDHKFFINRRYLVSQDGGHYRIAFDGPKGRFDLQVPSDTTYLLEGEATVENLSTEIIKLLMPKLPGNVEGVGVYIYEGYNKGSHIIARVPRE